MKSNSNFMITALLFSLLITCNHISAQGVWVRQNSGTSADLYGVHFINNNEGYVVGDSGVFLKTKDNGINWSKKSFGDYVFRAVQFIDSSNGYVVGYNSSGGVIFKTSDGGNSWDTFTMNGLCLALHFMNKDTGIVVGYGRFIVKTTDGGQSWLSLAYHHGVNTSRFINDICFVNDTVGFIASGECGPGFQCFGHTDFVGEISKTTDGGDNWKSLAGIGTFFSISFGSDSVGIVAGRGSYKTTDGGNKWDYTKTPFNNGLYFISPDTGWCAGVEGDSVHGVVAMTTNGGSNWIIEDSVDTGALYRIFFSGKNYGCVVGAGGTILKRTGITSVVTSENIPKQFVLYQNYPNPFNPTTTIMYDLVESGFVSLNIYDVLGREVKRIVNDIHVAGHYEITFEARNLPTGIYLCRLKFGRKTQVIKMLLIK